MRSFLTFLAIGLIALLTAALVAPIFVNWSSWRGPIEAELSRRLAAPVRTEGAIEIRLLPIPYVQVGRLSVGDVFACEGARFELALTALASGQLRFAEIDLERPAVAIALRANGAAPWPRGGLRAFSPARPSKSSWFATARRVSRGPARRRSCSTPRISRLRRTRSQARFARGGRPTSLTAGA